MLQKYIFGTLNVYFLMIDHKTFITFFIDSFLTELFPKRITRGGLISKNIIFNTHENDKPYKSFKQGKIY